MRGLSITDVYETTGVSRAQISRIESGKSDPRMSTVTQLLSCYRATLGDLESSPPQVLSLREVKQRAERAGERLSRTGVGPSDPEARLERKSALGRDTRLERESLATRA